MRSTAAEQITLQIDPSQNGRILRSLLTEITPSMTPKSIRKSIRRGEIVVNGQAVPSNYLVASGDIVNITIPIPRAMVEADAIRVLYEDDHIAFLDKPAGIVTTGKRPDAVINRAPHILTPSASGDGLILPRPVHRLDKNTRGVLVIAKTRTATKGLAEQFESREVRKFYLAVVEGRVTGMQVVSEPIEGREAISWCYGLPWQGRSHGLEVGLVCVVPETGRRHQVRKHLAGLGHPIVGDRHNGSRVGLKKDGFWLLAWRVSLLHPYSGAQLEITAPVPEDFLMPFDVSERELFSALRDLDI